MTTILTETLINNLRNLEELWPGQFNDFYEYGRYLADVMAGTVGPEITAEGFVYQASVATDGLLSNRHPRTGTKIDMQIAKFERPFLTFFTRIGEIADAIGGTEFSGAVKAAALRATGG